MKQCIIIGQTNVGKTAFSLSFAEYLGIDRVEVTFTYPDGFSTRQTYALSIARQELVGPSPHKTRCLQMMALRLPQGKGHKVLNLVDSTGLMDGIHEDPLIRKATAQTLQSLRTAEMILHMIDAANLGRVEPGDCLSEIDRQIGSYAPGRGHYILLANKMDLSTASLGLARLRTQYPGQLILPISALTKLGFREVKALVAKHL